MKKFVLMLTALFVGSLFACAGTAPAEDPKAAPEAEVAASVEEKAEEKPAEEAAPVADEEEETSVSGSETDGE